MCTRIVPLYNPCQDQNNLMFFVVLFSYFQETAGQYHNLEYNRLLWQPFRSTTRRPSPDPTLCNLSYWHKETSRCWDTMYIVAVVHLFLRNLTQIQEERGRIWGTEAGDSSGPSRSQFTIFAHLLHMNTFPTGYLPLVVLMYLLIYVYITLIVGAKWNISDENYYYYYYYCWCCYCYYYY
jgi:hypothetical protein